MTTGIETYEIAKTAAEQAEQIWLDCDHGRDELCEHRLASDKADEALVAAREALKTEPRIWDLCEGESGWYNTVLASSAEEALRAARDGVDAANYELEAGTIWIDVRVRCVLTDEEARDTVACDPEEPDCDHKDGHDWQAPLALVGGCRENPGVHGHGGGVTIHAVCVRCGCGRVRDTWAQRPDTGEQGLQSVRYILDEFDADDLARAS